MPRLTAILLASASAALAQGTVTTVIGKPRWELLRGIQATSAPLSSVYGVAPLPDGSIAFSETWAKGITP